MSNMLTEQSKSCLEEVSDKIADFLLSQGGMDNGYDTFASGEVRSDISGGKVKWNTPQVGDLTVKNIREIGRSLYADIQKIMTKYGVKKLVIENEHVEYGCFHTKVILTEEKYIELSEARYRQERDKHE